MPMDGENGMFHWSPEARATGNRNTEDFYKRDEHKIKDLERRVKELEDEGNNG